ncbi:NAD(P)/FAD-dependent oxidoreductase [Candidatus Bathyarchaeota archaeon]|nr:NAD(P)/FAD-dependent oxidoreductase [Candidatus Bathyarchaeota archaeon]
MIGFYTCDVLVVGAGPTGSTVATILAKKGFKTILCEEHNMVGRPCHCTGKLSVHAFREFNLPRDSILNSVRAAKLYSPGGVELNVRKDRVDSYIIDRELFDSRLSDLACYSGADLFLRTRAYDVEKRFEGHIILKAKKDGAPVRFKSRLVIDAEGATPVLPGKFGLRPVNDLLLGIQYEISGVQVESPDSVELYFGRMFAPGFFAWIVPLSECTARIGLCIRRSMATSPLNQYIDRFVRMLIDRGRLRDFKVEKVLAGVEPAGPYMAPSYADNIMVVGDSAGHVKPTSGGGIYFGLKAAKIAGETAIKCLDKMNMSKRHLRIYEDEWVRAFGRELKVTLLIRRILNSLTDDEVDRLIRKMSEWDIKRIIERYGDTAYQSRVIGQIIPHFLKRSLGNLDDISLLARIVAEGFLALIT